MMDIEPSTSSQTAESAEMAVFKVGDPVWAKLKGHPLWPAKIMEAPFAFKKPKENGWYVYFFGTGNRAWIHTINLTSHSETVLVAAKNKKKNDVKYHNGIDALANYAKSCEKSKRHEIKYEKSKDANKPEVQANILSSAPKKKPVGRPQKRKSATKKGCDPKKMSLNIIRSLSPEPIGDLPLVLSFPENPPNPTLPCNLRIGFIGMGALSEIILKDLMKSGHHITVWNSPFNDFESYIEMGAEDALIPSQIVVKCDITFCCISESAVLKLVMYPDHGILSGLEEARSLGLGPKGIVEMSTIDPEISKKIAKVVRLRGGVYMEGGLYPMAHDENDDDARKVLILAAGDELLFDTCQNCVRIFKKDAFYVSSNVGDGVQMRLSFRMMSAMISLAIAEAMTLVDRFGLDKSHFINFLKREFCSKYVMRNIQIMPEKAFFSEPFLKDLEKDISIATAIAHKNNLNLRVTERASERFRNAKLRDFSFDDNTPLYKLLSG